LKPEKQDKDRNNSFHPAVQKNHVGGSLAGIPGKGEGCRHIRCLRNRETAALSV